MSDGGADIIIKGGSVELDYDETQFPKNPGDPKKHENPSRRITKIVVVDDRGVERLNEESNGGLKWTVTVTTKN